MTGTVGGALGPVVGRLLDRLIAADAAAVEEIVDRVLDEHGPVALFDEVLRPALHEVGACWERGEISVADEHLATALAHRQLAKAYPQLVTAAPRSREAVLLVAVQGELHVLGLRMVADVLEGAGFAVHYAGADVPTASLEDTLRRLEPAVVGLSTTVGTDPAAVVAVIELIRACRPDAGIMIGGARAGVGDGRPGVHVVHRAGDALAVVERIVADGV